MNRISDFENNSNWKRSVGEKLDKIHFRNGHLHAECDSVTGFCTIHYDDYDPHESISSLVKHLVEGKTGKAVLGVVAIGILDQVLTGGQLRKSLI